MENSSMRDDVATKLPPTARLRKRVGRIWMRVLLAVVILLAALSGIWFLGVRPSLQQQAVLQIDRTWNMAMTTAFQGLSIYPHGPRTILISDTSISKALTFHSAYESQTWQVTVTPAIITLIESLTGCGQDCTFAAGCGQGCTFTAVLTIENSPYGYEQIQVAHAYAQGGLALIMSDDGLANALNSNLQGFNRALFVSRMKITLLEHAIDVQLH